MNENIPLSQQEIANLRLHGWRRPRLNYTRVVNGEYIALPEAKLNILTKGVEFYKAIAGGGIPSRIPPACTCNADLGGEFTGHSSLDRVLGDRTRGSGYPAFKRELVKKLVDMGLMAPQPVQSGFNLQPEVVAVLPPASHPFDSGEQLYNFVRFFLANEMYKEKAVPTELLLCLAKIVNIQFSAEEENSEKSNLRDIVLRKMAIAFDCCHKCYKLPAAGMVNCTECNEKAASRRRARLDLEFQAALPSEQFQGLGEIVDRRTACRLLGGAGAPVGMKTLSRLVKEGKLEQRRHSRWLYIVTASIRTYIGEGVQVASGPRTSRAEVRPISAAPKVQAR